MTVIPALEVPTPRRHGIPVAARPDRLVPRTALVERMRDDPGPIIVVEGPAGSGKSTLIAEWASTDPRPCAWLTIETPHRDAVVLLHALTRALRAACPGGRFDPNATGTDAMRGLSRLTRALADQPEPVLLVIDDIHLLQERGAIDLIVTLADRYPPSGRIALATRVDPGLPMARWQLAGKVLLIDRSDLDLDLDESVRLLDRLGVSDAQAAAASIHARTDGWMAGTHLMGLSYLRDGERGSPPSDETALSLVERHVRSELLDQLDPVTREVLVRTAHLDVVTGSLADAMCDAPGAAGRLAEVSDRGVLVTPLRPDGRSLRFHSLLRDVLRREIAGDPACELDVRLRAAAWYEAAGMFEEAIEHALGAGDLDRASRLVIQVAQTKYRTGGAISLLRWIDAFDEEALIERPHLMVLAAYVCALEGDASKATRWASLARSASQRVGSVDVAGPGPDLVSAMLCAHGPERMAADARRALDLHDERWRWRTSALFAMGMAEAMLDRPDAAAARFLELEQAQDAGAALVRLTSRAERAFAELQQRRWAAVQAILDLDRSAVLADPDSGRIAGMTWLIADARLAIHRGDPRAALERLERVQVGRVRLSWALPWLAVRTLTELARTQLLMGDHQGARISLSQARDTVAVHPRLGRLIDDLEQVTRSALAAPRGGDSWSSLTRAELRLLPYLQTYLTIKEIAERLGVSPNTAKTQALSIYGKLGASTRSEAIEAAVTRGLLEDVLADRT